MKLESIAIYIAMGVLISSLGFDPTTLTWWLAIALIVAMEYVSTRGGLLQGRAEGLYLLYVAQKDINKANSLCLVLTGVDPKTITKIEEKK